MFFCFYISIKISESSISDTLNSDTKCVFENKTGKNITALWAFNRRPIVTEEISCTDEISMSL